MERTVSSNKSAGILRANLKRVRKPRRSGKPTGVAAREASALAPVTAEQRLIAAQEFSQATLDALQEHAAVVDARGVVIRTSALWGKPDGGIGSELTAVAVGGDYLEACESSLSSIHEQSARLLPWGIRSVLSGRVRRFDADLALPGSGRPRWIHTRVQRFEAGGATYAVISHEDVTERRERERELQHLRTHQWHSERIEQTGVIIASLAHELSQPVTAILANAQASLRLLGRGELEPAENRQILTDIVADCKRAGAVIESLRMTLRRQKTEHRSEDIGEIVQRVIRLLRTELISQKVEVRLRARPGCVAQVDRAQIQQVVLNLMMNAIEAMPASRARLRRVWVDVARPAEDEVVIAVRDNGIGIAPEQIDKVFEAFWTTKRHGTGMGLSVSRAIVEAHGGRIWARRNRVGSTFSVALHCGTRQSV
jgi:signal transduction histidine kinase